MPTYRITIAYDGTNYCGWQVQINGPTVQAAIEKAMVKITGDRIRVTGSGRTDSGVHALAQKAGFECEMELSNEEWKRAMNGRLPEDIRILDVERLSAPFDPVRDCKAKRYRYVMCDDREHHVFKRLYRWHVHVPLDVDRMHEAGQVLVGEHDFASFQGAGSPRATTVRTIRDLTVERDEFLHDEVRLEVESNGFLYNMVRNIVGVLVDVGHGKLDADDVRGILAAKDRRKARMTAPPHGLFLIRVDY